MNRKRVGALAALPFVAALLIAAPPAMASGGGAHEATGSCSDSSNWKLKAKNDDGGIQVEFEVDSNVNGQTWGVRLRRDGNLFFSGSRTTQPPSGSFSVERKISNSAGDDAIVGRATPRRPHG